MPIRRNPSRPVVEAILGADSEALNRKILRWLGADMEDRLDTTSFAAELGISRDNLYQRVSRLRRKKTR